MTSTTRLILISVATATTLACRNSSDEKTDAPDIEKLAEPIAYSELEKVTWLIGTWQMIMQDQTTTEVWQKQNDSTLSGTSCTLIGSDTVSFETLSLTQNGNDLFYIPTVNGQNNNEPVKFLLTSAANGLLVFENPEHDFPQKITYEKLTEDSLYAEISGLNDGDLMEIGFPMNRVK